MISMLNYAEMFGNVDDVGWDRYTLSGQVSGSLVQHCADVVLAGRSQFRRQESRMHRGVVGDFSYCTIADYRKLHHEWQKRFICACSVNRDRRVDAIGADNAHADSIS